MFNGQRIIIPKTIRTENFCRATQMSRCGPQRFPIVPGAEWPWTCLRFRTEIVFQGDYYSDFEEVQEISDTTSPTITHFLKEQFSRHGIPEVFVLDSGPQLTSHEFRRFAEELEFKHVTSSPHHHKCNGKAQSPSHQEPFQESAVRWKRPIACPVRIQKHTC